MHFDGMLILLYFIEMLPHMVSIGVEVTIELLLLLSYVLAQVQLLTSSLSPISELHLLESDEMQSTLSAVLLFSKN